MKKILFSVILIVAGLTTNFAQNVVDFEDLELSSDSYWTGDTESEYFTSGYLKFFNNFSDFGTYTAWYGFAYSNMTDVTTPGYENQYSAAQGSGAANSSNYAVAFIGSDWMNDNAPIPSVIKVDVENAPESYKGMYISLNTYASLYMENTYIGSSYEAEKFWLTLQISAINTANLGKVTKNIVLADYRFENEEGFKLSDWTYIDLSWADGHDSLSFVMFSNDTIGGYGINTPTYFCLDNLGADIPQNIPEMITDAKKSYIINKGESVELFVSAKNGLQPYSFVWNNNESLDDCNLQTPIASPTATTTYTVTITDAAGTQSTEEITVTVNDVNIENQLSENLRIYSTNNGNNIIIMNPDVIDNVSIYDINGKMLINRYVNSTNGSISISHLTSGMYIVKVNVGANQISKKIVK